MRSPKKFFRNSLVAGESGESGATGCSPLRSTRTPDDRSNEYQTDICASLISCSARSSVSITFETIRTSAQWLISTAVCGTGPPEGNAARQSGRCASIISYFNAIAFSPRRTKGLAPAGLSTANRCRQCAPGTGKSGREKWPGLEPGHDFFGHVRLRHGSVLPPQPHPAAAPAGSAAATR